MSCTIRNIETALREPPPPWPAGGYDRPRRRPAAPFILPAPLPWYYTIDPMLLLGLLSAIGTGVLVIASVAL